MTLDNNVLNDVFLYYPYNNYNAPLTPVSNKMVSLPSQLGWRIISLVMVVNIGWYQFILISDFVLKKLLNSILGTLSVK